MRVPLLDLPRLHAPIRDQLHACAARVLDGGRFILGEEVAALEAEVAALCGRRHAVGLSSGSDALLAALMALGVGPGDEVITPAFSFVSAAEAVLRLGARPVFVDVGEDLCLDADRALACAGPRAKVLLPVDLFGRRCADERLAAAGLPIVEDGAQAIGLEDLGRRAACVTLSFFPSKNLGGMGDGGMALTDDEALADRLRLLRNHGARPKYRHLCLGGNLRLDALQAALLRVKLPFLREWNEVRARHARRYLDGLAALARLRLPPDEGDRVWHQLVVRVAAGEREALRHALLEAGVETEVYYPAPLHLQPAFASLGGQPGDHPRAEAACHEALALPLHAALDDDQVDHVVTTLRRLCR